MELREKMEMNVGYLGMVRCAWGCMVVVVVAAWRLAMMAVWSGVERTGQAGLQKCCCRASLTTTLSTCNAPPPPPLQHTPAQVQSQQRRAGVNVRRAQLTLDELKALPDAAPMYRSVGKA